MNWKPCATRLRRAAVRKGQSRGCNTPDGYTLYAATSAAIATLPLTENLAYDPASDLTYIMQMMIFPIGIAVKAESPFKSWADVVAFAKANPGKITYGTTGPASVANLGMQRLQALAGISLTHVPYRGSMEIVPAVLGDHVTLMVSGVEWKPQVDDGKMRLLMMWTDKRLAAFANVPTGREIGYAFDLDVSIGLVAPKGMEAGVQSRVHGAFKTALETPSIRALIEKYDMVPSYLDGPSYKARIAGIAADMKPIIDKLGLARKE
jgi:tripartite-type tricarboxylate transporter receptor subunit TctC